MQMFKIVKRLEEADFGVKTCRSRPGLLHKLQIEGENFVK